MFNLQNVMKLLLISNSTNSGEEFLQYPLFEIKKHLEGVKSTLFIPYAAVTFSYDRYAEQLTERLAEIDIEVISIHNQPDPLEAVLNAESICIGGGNTFALLSTMQREGIVEAIHQRVAQGIPYLGWSAGSNVSCPTISTTNDMPITPISSFGAVSLIPFQINPHYTDTSLEGHAGESREQRIEEYIAMNRDRYVVGLREGTMLKLLDGTLELIGERSMRIFKYGEPAREVKAGDSLQFLL